MPAAPPSETQKYAEADPPRPTEQGPLPIYGFEWKRDGKVLLSYLLDSEVHTFAFSVAANAILSFIPFIVMLYTIAHGVFHSESMIDVINEMVRYLMPSNQDWIIRNLGYVASRGGVRFLSLIMILVSCTGIFLPLEVALNRSWGVLKSRNYLMNQLVALGLALWMVILGLASIALNQVERWLLTLAFFGHTEFFLYKFINDIALMLTTLIAGILLFFAIYWLLPNRRMPPNPVMRVAVVTAILWVGSKYLFVAILPHLDLPALYGPFSVSVGLLLWAYVSGLLLFAGAQFSAMRHLSRANAKKSPPLEPNPHMITPAQP
ncbi:MAG TPA: YihY/virulence factor BrkB family protein [Acidobacteriaceae bacterium]